MILTDTPQKELLKSCKKIQKAPKRGKLKTLFIIYLFYLYIYPPDSQESDGGANT